MRYFLTFACYGAHLHGDEWGSVDRHHNLVGSRRLEPDAGRVMAERREMLEYPMLRISMFSTKLVGSGTRGHTEALWAARLAVFVLGRSRSPLGNRLREPQAVSARFAVHLLLAAHVRSNHVHAIVGG